jgi:hypothetical protein
MSFVITEERLEKCREARKIMREERFEAVRPVLGDEAINELRDLYNIFDENYYLWLASLYDPEIGGFYCVQSGRDTKGFLPDIESTVQALYCTEVMGLTYGKPMREAYSDKVKAALLGFVRSLQDPENGYFYHPQWGRKINIPSRGRDLSWSMWLYEMLDKKPLYPTPLDKSDDGKKSASLPEHLQTIEAFKSYLSAFDLKTKSYWTGNMLQSQTQQIKAAGPEFVKELFAWLKENQRPESGVWQEVVNYDSVNGLMKLTLIYSALEEPVPNSRAALQSAIDVALSDEKITFCCQFYNPFSTMSGILHNIKKFEGAEAANELQNQIRAQAPEIIRKTREKVSLCKNPENGSFSYNPYGAPRGRVSMMAPIGLGLPTDSDINGGTICLNGAVRNMCDALGIKVIPAFCDEDAKLFHDILNNAEQYPKINEKPEWFEDLLRPEGAEW